MVRKRMCVRGRVQGVGFRPFVYRLAQECELTGHVRNDSGGVIIEAQGREHDFNRFADALEHRAPALAKITALQIDTLPPDVTETTFHIESTDGHAEPTAEILPDIALCPDCLRELHDAHDRRHGYGLINCTHCGPRYSIIREIPYDRPNTTMASFTMCPQCQHEYDSPLDRRFHAQPTACPDCGPRVWAAAFDGVEITGNPYLHCAGILRVGGIVTIKGLGGFHLAARADSAAAVARLREVKRRNAKPFAVMVRDVATAEHLAHLSAAGLAQLTSPAAPIVLARRRIECGLPKDIAPGNHRLGVMLPYTPMQHLLFEAAPDLHSLIMTSGNVSDEPLAITNEDALTRLGGMCDAFLLHNRPIERCVDDSVVLDLGDSALPVRVARGRAPAVLHLDCRPTAGLALGGELKNTLAILRGQSLTASQHMGDLKHPLAFAAFKRAIDDLVRLLALKPQWIVHDLHPGYLSTLHAGVLAKTFNVPLIGVQHHHAHAAALMAEHHVTGKILALVCDGVGYGTDGTSWGCELLAADFAGFKRLGRMRPLQLPGGDASARDARRCAVAALHLAYGFEWPSQPICHQLFADLSELTFIQHMLARNLQVTSSSALGRLFDAAAALLGLCTTNTFEGQAAMSLESSTASSWGGGQSTPETEPNFADTPAFANECAANSSSDLAEFNPAPLIRHIVEGLARGERRSQLAIDFHAQLAAALEAFILHGVNASGITTIGLTGGVFMNQQLTQLLRARLSRHGLQVLTHQEFPPNDGGISIGQAAVASHLFTGNGG